MEFDINSRLGMVGVIMTFLSIAALYIWPEKKWIGWVSLVIAAGLLLYWGIAEIQHFMGSGKTPHIVSIVIGCIVGGCIASLIWSSFPQAKPSVLLVAQVMWASPAPIAEGAPLSALQLNAVSPVDGVFTYDPTAGTILQVGIHSLTATFYARDSTKYMRHIETRSILVTPAPSSISHPSKPDKPAHFELKEPGFKPLPNSPPFRLMIQMINTGGRSAFDLEYQLLMIDQESHVVARNISGSVGGEIPPNSPTPYYNDSIVFPMNVREQFIILCLHYKDAEDSKITRTQIFYMQWSGVINGKTEPDFTYVSIEQEKELKSLVDNMLKIGQSQ